MIYNNDCTLPKEYLEQLTAEGLERSLLEMIRVLVNEAIQIERKKHLNAKPYERSHERSGVNTILMNQCYQTTMILATGRTCTKYCSVQSQ